MITPQSTPAEVVAHHRQAIADFKIALTYETRPSERAAILRRIAGHEDRLAKAEADRPTVQVKLRLSPEDAECLRQRAAETGETMSAIVERLVMEYGPPRNP